MTSPSGSTPAEAKAFLDAHAEIEAFDIVLTDTNGVGRGKIVRRHELKGLYENGRHMPISILGLDITGEDVHETGLIWDSGDGDLRAWPLPGALVPLHGTLPPRGFRTSSARKNGPPASAVTTPTGRSSGETGDAIARAAASARTRNAPPPRNDAGTSSRWSGPSTSLSACGTITPTKPTSPEAETAAPVTSEPAK